MPLGRARPGSPHWLGTGRVGAKYKRKGFSGPHTRRENEPKRCSGDRGPRRTPYTYNSQKGYAENIFQSQGVNPVGRTLKQPKNAANLSWRLGCSTLQRVGSRWAAEPPGSRGPTQRMQA